MGRKGSNKPLSCHDRGGHGREPCVRLIEWLAFDFDGNFIAIRQIVLVAQLHITGNLHHGTWMSSGPVVVSVCTQNESTPPKNSTRHDAHAHRTAILVRLQPGYTPLRWCRYWPSE